MVSPLPLLVEQSSPVKSTIPSSPFTISKTPAFNVIDNDLLSSVLGISYVIIGRSDVTGEGEGTVAIESPEAIEKDELEDIDRLGGSIGSSPCTCDDAGCPGRLFTRKRNASRGKMEWL